MVVLTYFRALSLRVKIEEHNSMHLYSEENLTGSNGMILSWVCLGFSHVFLDLFLLIKDVASYSFRHVCVEK